MTQSATSTLPPPAAGAVRLSIRNMVCPRCLRVVQRELEKAGLVVDDVALGAANVRMADGSPLQEPVVQQALQAYGFALVEDPRDQLVEQVKALVVELIHYTPVELQPFHTYSHFISERVGRAYAYLSHQFSVREGLTLEKYIIRQKVERAKELLSYQDANVSSVAKQLGYSSAAHLTNQFRQVTGMSPSDFQALGPGSAGRLGLETLS
ncbi:MULTISPECIES: helix-turn-helix domain-containing protein [Hymenobacter]|uniref:AraC family transcriptional regulator n=1 Tax=Hymenobacter metallilatus TaxID=2493666 RepID=A0A428IYY9_9BACT|nr:MULTISPECIES: AraC family transcriptional regulator [Hymenobacter]RSK24537.1 AraC family transcriptional regulator [Hymenobacter metallilatus]